MSNYSREYPEGQQSLAFLLSKNQYFIDFIDYFMSGFSREFFAAQQSFAAEAERRPAAPTGTHKPTDTIAPRLLRDG
ncbi:hypothetical protein [Pseudomonas sp.]|uniref:hypothetical protein n=1 Tax=Pseudomonas sp. TaxID=306 RepID=UPI0035669A89